MSLQLRLNWSMHVMVIWNPLDDGSSHSGPLLRPSESIQGVTPGTNPRQEGVVVDRHGSTIDHQGSTIDRPGATDVRQGAAIDYLGPKTPPSDAVNAYMVF
jgi:hypothetical protein